MSGSEKYTIVNLDNKYSKFDSKDLRWLGYHGSQEVMSGRLKGQTDTDYFYFKCPKCGDILGVDDVAILDYSGSHETCVLVKSRRPKQNKIFTIKIRLICKKCKLKDYVKISNIGWSGGDFKCISQWEKFDEL